MSDVDALTCLIVQVGQKQFHFWLCHPYLSNFSNLMQMWLSYLLQVGCSWAPSNRIRQPTAVASKMYFFKKTFSLFCVEGIICIIVLFENIFCVYDILLALCREVDRPRFYHIYSNSRRVHWYSRSIQHTIPVKNLTRILPGVGTFSIFSQFLFFWN